MSSAPIGFSIDHQYLDDGTAPGNNTPQDDTTIVIEIEDDDRGATIGPIPVDVKNVSPAVDLEPVAMINENDV